MSDHNRDKFAHIPPTDQMTWVEPRSLAPRQIRLRPQDRLALRISSMWRTIRSWPQEIHGLLVIAFLLILVMSGLSLTHWAEAQVTRVQTIDSTVDYPGACSDWTAHAPVGNTTLRAELAKISGISSVNMNDLVNDVKDVNGSTDPARGLTYPDRC